MVVATGVVVVTAGVVVVAACVEVDAAEVVVDASAVVVAADVVVVRGCVVVVAAGVVVVTAGVVVVAACVEVEAAEVVVDASAVVVAADVVVVAGCEAVVVAADVVVPRTRHRHVLYHVVTSLVARRFMIASLSVESVLCSVCFDRLTFASANPLVSSALLTPLCPYSNVVLCPTCHTLCCSPRSSVVRHRRPNSTLLLATLSFCIV